ncbi:MAG: sugar ABC transporter substrate-binding protein, partial [Spirochaetaceae bacterium]|nr:sugar ABC transporter substrate-binding protein [Spirochaetaceae bacterium]
MKRALAALAALTLAASLAGAQAKTTIKYAFWGNPDAIGVEKDIIDEFMTLNPGIVVEPVVSAYGDYHTKLLTMIAGGAAPDVMRVDSYYFTDFMKVGALKGIGDLVARDKLDLSSYYQQGIQECSYEGALYGLPWGTAPLYMFVNLDVLDKAGVKLPSNDWSWDDFYAICKAVSKGEGADRIYGFAYDPGTISGILPWVWANGGDLFNAEKTKFTLDQAPSVQAIQRLADLLKQGYMPPETVSATADINTRLFVNGKIAMRMGSAAEILSTQKVEGVRFEVMPMPNGKIKSTSVVKSNIIGMASGGKKQDAAWAFMKYLRGPEGKGETLYMKAKRMPPTMDSSVYWGLYADATKYPKLVEANSKAISKTYGHKLPLRAGWLEVEQIVKPAL